MAGDTFFPAYVSKFFRGGGLDINPGRFELQQFSQARGHSLPVGRQPGNLRYYRDIYVYQLQALLRNQLQDLAKEDCTVFSGKCRVRIWKMLTDISSANSAEHGVTNSVQHNIAI